MPKFIPVPCMYVLNLKDKNSVQCMYNVCRGVEVEVQDTNSTNYPIAIVYVVRRKN